MLQIIVLHSEIINCSLTLLCYLFLAKSTNYSAYVRARESWKFYVSVMCMQWPNSRIVTLHNLT